VLPGHECALLQPGDRWVALSGDERSPGSDMRDGVAGAGEVGAGEVGAGEDDDGNDGRTTPHGRRGGGR